VLCDTQTVTFNDSVYYWHPGGQVFCELNEWWENTTCIDSNGYFYNPDSSAARYFWYKNIAGYTGPLYKEMIAWDFDAQRYLTKADGTDSLDVNGLRIRMEDYQRVMDSANIEVWINPADSIQNGVPGYGKYNWDMNTAWRSTQWTYGPSKKYGEKFGVGIYDVTLWARDSMGCWTPNTKQNAVRVLGVRAFFGVCDTCNTILVCTPSSIEFKDTSEIIENKEDVPSGRSVTKGKMDSVVYWSWDFGDERDTSILQNPIHTYLDAHDSGYTVRLKVKTMQGCEDEITKKFFIKIIGPQAKFFLPQDVICVNDSAYVIDSSSFEERTQSYWTTDPVLAQAISDFKKRRKVGLYFDKPGKYNITVGVSAKVNDPITGIEKQCLDVYPNPDDPTEDTITVTVRDYDPFTIKASDYVICPGEEIIFSVVTDSTYTGYNSVVWNMGLENSVYVKAVAEEIGQVYAEPGKYEITAIGSGDFPICPLTDAVTINVKEVKAEIEVDERSNEAMGNYVFLNRSLNALYSRWRVFKLPDTLTVIHEETYSDSSRFVYVDFTEGEYLVELLVSDYVDPDDARACTDRAVVRLIVEPILQFYNVITPNGDGVNDWWEMQLQVVPEWELTIYNRWGAVMMRADQDDELECYFKEETQTTVCKFWDGTNRTEGGNAAPGTYFFVFKSRFKGETELIPANGTITLVR
jgi:gliding motility-associated-like protein